MIQVQVRDGEIEEHELYGHGGGDVYFAQRLEATRNLPMRVLAFGRTYGEIGEIVGPAGLLWDDLASSPFVVDTWEDYETGAGRGAAVWFDATEARRG